MRTYLVAFGLSLVASLLLTRVVCTLALRWGITDSGGGRKIHKQPIPRLGGVAVALAAMLPLIGLFLWDNKISRELTRDVSLITSLIGGGGIILAVGIFDDLKGARAWVKLLGQVLAALVVFYAGNRIEAISVPFFQPVRFGILSLPATVFWMVLVMNAINLIDGLDGLAGGVVVLAGGTLFVMSVVEDNTMAALLLAVVVGGTAGFLPFNVHPASIFLGDSGSLWLGFILALVSVHSSQKSYALFSIVAAMLALGLPIFDLSMAVVRRYLSGQPIFSADQHHVHHILLRKGLSQSQSAVALFAAAVVLEGLALVFIYADDAISALAIAALVPLIVVAVKVLGYGDLIRAARRTKLMDETVREAERRGVRVEAFRRLARQAAGFEPIWVDLQACADDVGWERLVVQRVGSGPCQGVDQVTWHRRQPAATEHIHHQSLAQYERKLEAGGRVLGRLQVSWWREREVFRPFDESLVDLVADGLTLALVDLDARAEAEANAQV